MKPKLHLATSDSPISERCPVTALCGEEVSSAKLAYMWDEAVMGTLLVPPRGACGACGRLLGDSHTGERRFVYAVIEGSGL